MDYLKRSKELFDESLSHRRFLHQIPEIGLNCTQTMNYIEKQLLEIGCQPVRCGSGIVVTLGKQSGKTILLRSDVDALPMKEESERPFRSQCENAHTCGHDFHGAMMLTAAKMLKENEGSLKGCIKLMFQPGEETFMGSKDMVAHGLLSDPEPDVCLAYHVSSGNTPVGLFMYNDSSTMMNSSDNFTIEIIGKGSHGAYPESGIDPINIACHLVLALESIIAREVTSNTANVLTIGKIEAGDAGNIIPNEAKLYGTLRCDNNEQREFILKRLNEVSSSIAASFRGSAKVILTSGTPPLICDKKSVDDFVKYMKELPVENQMGINGIHAGASDDLAVILQKIPGAYMYLSAGFTDGREVYAQHHPKVVFNEDVLISGPAYLAHCATRWLEENC